MVRRNYIFNSIRSVFELFGYLPIETPAMENLSTLIGKYGEEGDKLLFKILNSGNFLDDVPEPAIIKSSHKELTRYISEKGLRYDLTVPFARFVVQHQNELTFPFKRYQIQPVWRADRPQKGRYREFFQCDVDVIGSHSLIYEVELIQIIDEVFSRLGIEVMVLVNNRKILAGIAEAIGASDKLTDITVAVDKMDKIGMEKVCEELHGKGLPDEAIASLRPVLNMEGKIFEKIPVLEKLCENSPLGKKGLEELTRVFLLLKDLNLRNKWNFDVRLARGLNYYTGTIIEVKAQEVSLGSICGGGRYDDLTGMFGLPGVSGVGISFGADRIYDVMMELKRFPETIQHTTTVLFSNFGPDEEKYSLHLLETIRQAGIPSEIYPEASKLRKQMEYADRKKIPFVILIGKNEMENSLLTVKNMATGEQTSMKQDDLISLLKKSI
jgi:histidyl-tRNA synthetase